MHILYDSAHQELKADMAVILQIIPDRPTNSEDTWELGISGELLHTGVPVDQPVIFDPLPSSLTSTLGSAQPFSAHQVAGNFQLMWELREPLIVARSATN
jgi:hypothetical protein